MYPQKCLTRGWVGQGIMMVDWPLGTDCCLFFQIRRKPNLSLSRHFTAVNSGRAGGGILRRILFIIKFHRRLGLSELCEMLSAKIQFCFSHYYLHRWH